MNHTAPHSAPHSEANLNARLKPVSEQQFARLMRNVMNEGAENLSPKVSERLRAARRLALNARKPEHSTRGVVGYIYSAFDAVTARLAVAVPAVALGVGLFVMSQNNADSYVQSVAEIDTQVLSQEVPLDALLDKGFARFVQVGE